MYSKVKSLGISGMEAFAVTVECDISSGLPRFDVVGLPDTVVKESRERVRSTIKKLQVGISAFKNYRKYCTCRYKKRRRVI